MSEQKEKVTWAPLGAKAAGDAHMAIIANVPSHDLIHQLRRHIFSGIALTGEQVITIASRKNLSNGDRLKILTLLYPRMVDRNTFNHDKLLTIVNKEHMVAASNLIEKLRKDASGHAND